MSSKRWLPWLALLLGALIHGAALMPAWEQTRTARHGRDFASYHYAVQAAEQGLDPYDAKVLGQLARQEKTRKSVHPFFYPPPFLLAMQWTRPLSLESAYKLWFWLDALALLAAGLALYRWLPRPGALVAMGVLLAAFSPIPNNHLMGQMNLPVLALTLWGMHLSLSREESGWQVSAGALVGLAAMLKMSPGLLVAWWLLRGQWKAAAGAVGAAILLSVATLPVLGWEQQLHFYVDVLPSFSSGGYGGLTVPISLFGNHSIANLWAQLWPAPDALSPIAHRVTSLSVLILVVCVFAATRKVRDPLPALLGTSALFILMALTPVYTYEHHVVWALPAWVALSVALWEGKLHRGWIALLLPALVVACWPIASWKALAKDAGALRWWMQEAKSMALVLQLSLSSWLAFSLTRVRRRAD